MKKKKIALKRKIEHCPICNQAMDLCVTSHKNKPFIDNKNYLKMCFTCYSAPKILSQKYDKNGYIIEEIQLEYNHKNLHTAEELVNEGSSDSLAYAKRSIMAIKQLQISKDIKNKQKPKLEFYII